MCTTMIDITHEQQQPLGYGAGDVENRYGKGWAEQRQRQQGWIYRGGDF